MQELHCYYAWSLIIYKSPQPKKFKNLLRKLNIFFIYESVEVFAMVPKLKNISESFKVLQLFYKIKAFIAGPAQDGGQF